MLVLLTGMLPTGVLFFVMVTVYVWIIGQCAGQIGADCLIRIAGYTAEKGNAGLLQRILGACANTAANQHICLEPCKQSRQGTVPLPIGIYDLGMQKISVFHLVKLEILASAVSDDL